MLKRIYTYLLVVMLCMLWVFRFGVTSQQASMYIPGAPVITAETLDQESSYKAYDRTYMLASLHNDVNPFTVGARIEQPTMPVFRINPNNARFLSVLSDMQHNSPSFSAPAIRQQDDRSFHFLALLHETDYYIYTLRKIII